MAGALRFSLRHLLDCESEARTPSRQHERFPMSIPHSIPAVDEIGKHAQTRNYDGPGHLKVRQRRKRRKQPSTSVCWAAQGCCNHLASRIAKSAV